MKKLLLFCLAIVGCTSPHKEDSLIEERAKEFFDMYQARDNWAGFQDLYADDLEFEDVIFRLKYDKTAFVNFYNWPDTAFKKHPDYPNTLVLEELALTDSSSIGRGYFTPFYYGGVLMSSEHHWRFNMTLTFNKEGKIKRHIDFIEYPPIYLKSAAESLLKEGDTK